MNIWYDLIERLKGSVMLNVVSLKQFKQEKRKKFLVRYGDMLNAFIEDYISTVITEELLMLKEYLIASHWGCEQSWDYWDMRDMLSEALERAVADLLFSEVSKQWWFDKSCITRAEIVDRSVSAYILHVTKPDNAHLGNL